jgi:peptidoglycan hydrolase-like protein with peptidoglycan-binding domain
MSTSFVKAGLTLQKGTPNCQEVKDLQQALRELGYLRGGVDGNFGSGTEKGVMALQYDLLNNDGKGSDGQSPVMVKAYNKGRVTAPNGIVDQNMAECIAEMLSDASFVRLPIAKDPVEANKEVLNKISTARSTEVPVRFIAAILKQESDLKHYNEQDAVITVGLDTNNSAQTFAITSRGYGAGQFTIFHHPPRQEEVDDFMNNVEKNLSKAEHELRQKFDKFVAGPTDTADDRIAEIGSGALRVCKYASTDPRYLSDCAKCAADAGSRDITENFTPVYKGSPTLFTSTQYYSPASYTNIPKRENFGCDWPYAVRRYNGGGINSYHYQVRVMRNVRDLKL